MGIPARSARRFLFGQEKTPPRFPVRGFQNFDFDYFTSFGFVRLGFLGLTRRGMLSLGSMNETTPSRT